MFGAIHYMLLCLVASQWFAHSNENDLAVLKTAKARPRSNYSAVLVCLVWSYMLVPSLVFHCGVLNGMILYILAWCAAQMKGARGLGVAYAIV